MDKRIAEIKKLIKKECIISKRIGIWFYDTHLLGVEEFSKKLLKKLPKADKEIVMLGVWLHDLQRIRNIKGDHEKMGAKEAEKVLINFGYSDDKIKKVKNIILSHSCGVRKPKTVEGKILSSADAMAHYFKDFYLKVSIIENRDIEEFKKWSLEKLDLDYNKKIYFDFAKKMVKKRHEALKYILTMK